VECNSLERVGNDERVQRRVFIPFWVIECCLTPPEVGAAITLLLDPVEGAEAARADGATVFVGHGMEPLGAEPTYGIVRSIEVEEVDLTPGARAGELTRSPARYRFVDTSPRWFAHLRKDETGTEQTGVIVTLEETAR
jgi:uncharacterized protein DUF6578